jgi:hypothetical protein
LTHKLTIGATLLALGLGGAGMANAQPVYVGRGYEASLPPYEIVAIVRSAGMAPLTRPVRRGQDYVVIAGTRNGGQMRVVVDAYEGDILRVTPVAAAQPYGVPAAYPYERQYESRFDPRSRLAPIGPEIKDPPPGTYPRSGYGPSSRYDGVPPVPPRSVPDARVANAPPPAALPRPAVKPAHPPLPRSRPSVASTQAAAPAPAAVAPPPAAAPPQQTQAAPTPPKLESAPKTETPAETPVLVPVAPLE